MRRYILPAALGLVLLLTETGHSPGDSNPAPTFGKPDLALTVTVKASRDEEYAKVHKLLDQLKKRGATHLRLRVCKKGEWAAPRKLVQWI